MTTNQSQGENGKRKAASTALEPVSSTTSAVQTSAECCAGQAHEIIETGKKARMVSTLTQKFMAMKDRPRKPAPFPVSNIQTCRLYARS